MGPYDGEAVERCLACEAVVNRAHRHILPFGVLFFVHYPGLKPRAESCYPFLLRHPELRGTSRDKSDRLPLEPHPENRR